MLKEFKSHLVFVLLAVLLLITGLFIYKDYGISWDEDAQRTYNGLVNYDYIHNDNYDALINGNEKYHGPAFEIALIYIEKILDLKTSRGFHLMRHLVNFLVYFISVIFFYLIIFKEFKDKRIAIIGTLFLILTPRIFADSFYNSKDIIFMSFIIINIYTTLWLLRSFSIPAAIINGFVTGLVIDTRVMGVIIPAFTCLLILIYWIRKREDVNRILKSSITYIFSSMLFVYAFWPVLWRSPFRHFINSISEMSKYHWESYLIFLGKAYDAQYIPQHYIPVWMAITIPLLFMILFFSGTTVLISRLIKKKPLTNFDWINLYIFFVPLFSVIFLNSIVYDGWRHLFFIYPSFLFIGLKGYKWISERLANFNSGNLILNSGTYAYCGYMLFVMISLHPYENIYFNSFAGNSLNDIRKKFEIDYWGLSYYEAIDHILRIDSSSQIYYCPAENPGRDNIRFFDDDQKVRMCITVPTELADYYVTTYRYQHDEKSYPAQFNIERNGVIASVFDLRRDKIELDSYTPVVTLAGPLSANFDSLVEYGCEMKIDVPSQTSLPNIRTYISTEFYVKSEDPVNCRYVLQIDSSNGDLMHYDANAIEFYRQGKLTKISWRVSIPVGISSSNKIKMYLWNMNRNNFNVSDISVNIYALPDSLYKNFKSKYPLAFYRE